MKWTAYLRIGILFQNYFNSSLYKPAIVTNLNVIRCEAAEGFKFNSYWLLMKQTIAVTLNHITDQITIDLSQGTQLTDRWQSAKAQSSQEKDALNNNNYYCLVYVDVKSIQFTEPWLGQGNFLQWLGQPQCYYFSVWNEG